MGKHSKLRRHRHPVARPRGMVDIRTGDTHLLTPDAAAAGRQATGRYRSLCGADILPAALVDPGNGLLPAVPVHHHPHPTRRKVTCPPTWHGQGCPVPASSVIDCVGLSGKQLGSAGTVLSPPSQPSFQCAFRTSAAIQNLSHRVCLRPDLAGQWDGPRVTRRWLSDTAAPDPCGPRLRVCGRATRRSSGG